ncbi:MAG: glycosyltransferase [Bacteroidales bacterium]|nr:glycosyltransferase [Bacteroidales bacterium]
MIPILSIIVPVYNVAGYLPRCMERILSQSFTDFEVLLVDDGSIDGSHEIYNQLAEKDSRIRVFQKENGGVSSARNLGLRQATGEWICFVDADDILMEDGLQHLVDCISGEFDMVWGGYEILNERGERTYAISDRISESLTSEEGLEMLFLPRYYRYLGYVWGRLFRRSVIVSSGITFDEDIRYNEDRLFCTRFMCVSNAGIRFTTIPVYGYYERSDSAMGLIERSFRPEFITDMMAMIRMRKVVYATYPENHRINELVDSACYSSWRRMAGMKGYKDTHLWAKVGIVGKLIKGLGLGRFLSFDWARNKNRINKVVRKFF